jgi:hypothetical protein
MTDIRIVCTHDGLKLAETLMRLLEAEQHRVRLTYGRQALAALEEARALREAVLLIWSQDARSQTYMLEWVRNTDATRLCEIARASDWPTIKRKSPVIDFSHWRGERGGRAWNALNERLRTIGDVLDPPKGPSRESVAALAFGVAAAMVGAVVVRMNTIDEMAPDPAVEDVATIENAVGVGGPLTAVEPASVDDLMRFRPVGANIEQIDWEPTVRLADLPDVSTPALRDPTLFERVSDLIPPLPNLRGQDDTTQN